MDEGYTAPTVNQIDRLFAEAHDGGMAEPDLPRLLLEASRALGTEVVASLDERGFPDARPGHAVLFMHIDRRWGTRLTDLARRARMTKQGMMLVVDELETRGYVRRVPDPEDARAKVVRLTARGRRYVAEARRAVAAVEARARRELGDRRYEVLWSALEELAGATGDSPET
jgi:DNA-binding MarR family transcriptional regulator